MHMARTLGHAVGRLETAALGFRAQRDPLVVERAARIAARPTARARPGHAGAIQWLERLAVGGDRRERQHAFWRRLRLGRADDRLEVDLHELVGEFLLLEKVEKRGITVRRL